MLSADSLASYCYVHTIPLQALDVYLTPWHTCLWPCVHAYRQVWLVQSSLAEICCKNFHQLPLLPGQIFGPAAQEALDRHVSVSETRSRHVRPPFWCSFSEYWCEISIFNINTHNHPTLLFGVVGHMCDRINLTHGTQTPNGAPPTSSDAAVTMVGCLWKVTWLTGKQL